MNARTMKGGYVEATLVCRWCNLAVPPRRRTFCSDYCVNEWRLRTDPGYLREKAFERDEGVCAACGIDAVAAFNELRRTRGAARLRRLREWGLKSVGRSLWEADHIVPVAEGGGQCDLTNIRTLCLRCHRVQTGALRERLKLRPNLAPHE